MNNGSTGAATAYRFDNTREDSVNTGELGVRGKLQTAAWGTNGWPCIAVRLSKTPTHGLAQHAGHQPVSLCPQPASVQRHWLYGGDLAHPLRTGTTRLTSFAVGDTLTLLTSACCSPLVYASKMTSANTLRAAR